MALLRDDPTAVSRLGDLESLGERLCTTPVTAYELFNGAWRSNHAERNLRDVTELLDDLPLLEMDLEASMLAGWIHAKLGSIGTPIGVEDELISGIVLRHRETLVTRNAMHFSRVQGLEVLSW